MNITMTKPQYKRWFVISSTAILLLFLQITMITANQTNETICIIPNNSQIINVSTISTNQTQTNTITGASIKNLASVEGIYLSIALALSLVVLVTLIRKGALEDNLSKTKNPDPATRLANF